MRVLGLDPGSRKTGFGVVERSGNSLRWIAHGAVSPSTKLDLPHRLHDIAARVGEVIDETRPMCVVVEKAFYHESVHSTLVLGHVRGALLVAAIQRGVAVAEYSPREIKLSVVGRGGATKDQVAMMIRRLLALDHTPQSDAADALAAAVCHLHRARFAAPSRPVSPGAQRLAALLARGSRG